MRAQNNEHCCWWPSLHFRRPLAACAASLSALVVCVLVGKTKLAKPKLSIMMRPPSSVLLMLLLLLLELKETRFVCEPNSFPFVETQTRSCERP